MKSAVLVVVGLLASTMLRADVQARQRGRALGDDAPVTPVEIQRMFDAYALGEAQNQLKLGDDQYLQFLSRYKALQEVRRRSQAERGRIIQELRRLSADPKAEGRPTGPLYRSVPVVASLEASLVPIPEHAALPRARSRHLSEEDTPPRA